MVIKILEVVPIIGMALVGGVFAIAFIVSEVQREADNFVSWRIERLERKSDAEVERLVECARRAMDTLAQEQHRSDP